MLWRLIRGSTVFHTGTREDCLSYAYNRDWIARSWQDDGTENAPRWVGREFALLPMGRR